MILGDKLQVLSEDAIIDCANNYAVYIPIPEHKAKKDILISLTTV